MINVVLLGTGNVATHLFHAFSASENIEIRQIYNHSEESLSFFPANIKTTTSINELLDADIYILALKDDVISKIAPHLKSKKGLVAHTSGAVSLEALKDLERNGVFYPLQTFSKELQVDYRKIPFCIEATHPEDLELLKEMAGEISEKMYEISSPQRKKLHLAAVFVCNFVNHMYSIGEDICEENDIPFEILWPLIQATARKVYTSSPKSVQTGPAIRNDQTTINAHLDLISKQENKEIYKLLTQAIQNFNGKKL